MDSLIVSLLHTNRYIDLCVTIKLCTLILRMEKNNTLKVE